MRQSQSARPGRPGFDLNDLYPYAGLALGGVCIVAGVVLLALPVADQTLWQGSGILGFQFRVQTGRPGLLVICLGIVLVFITRPRRRGH